jgi:hypothetical protein
MTNDLYIYSAPIHNAHFYYVWIVYYFQYVMMNLGGSGFISLGLWYQVTKACKAGIKSIQQEESVVVSW